MLECNAARTQVKTYEHAASLKFVVAKLAEQITKVEPDDASVVTGTANVPGKT